MWVAVTMLVVGLTLGFAVTISPSWISLGLFSASLVVAGASGVTIAVMGRMSRVRRELWHAIGPWLLAAGGTLWLALHTPYIKGLDLVSLGFILALCGLIATALAAYFVSPWRGRGIVQSWLRPQQDAYDPDKTTLMQRPPVERHW